MNETVQSFADHYTAALQDYLVGGGESALQHGYELGRRAIAEGLGILEFAKVHQGALAQALRSASTVKESARIVTLASNFFMESLSTFEMIHRGFRETIATLHDVNEMLVAVNKELESFSYSVAHDLRAPLRAISGFSRVVLESYSDQLDAEGKRLLTIIGKNVQTMGQLIDDLLAFSRLGRKTIEISDIDMGALAKAVFEELKASTPERKLLLKLKRIPPARGDRTMIRQVWVNVLSNAIKFTRPKETAVIEVGGWVEAQAHTYYVKDNGVGFDMRYADKLFGVFQRLHPADEFEGTGVGLAIVQRIIQRHGGRVWAEGKVNDGTTFYFTIVRLSRVADE